MDPVEKFRQELPVIRQAPFVHGLSMLVGWIVAFVVMAAFWGGITVYFMTRAERFQTENTDLVANSTKLSGRIIELEAKVVEQEPLLAELEDFRARSQLKVDIVKQLTPYVAQGNRLLTQEIGNDDEVRKWLKEVGAWESVTGATLGVFSQPNGLAFRSVTSNQPFNGYNNIHGVERRFLNERLKVLTGYVQLREEEDRREAREAAQGTVNDQTERKN